MSSSSSPLSPSDTCHRRQWWSGDFPDYHREMEKLRKENFNLKLRIYLFEKEKFPSASNESRKLEVDLENEIKDKMLNEALRKCKENEIECSKAQKQVKELTSKLEATRDESKQELEAKVQELTKVVQNKNEEIKSLTEQLQEMELVIQEMVSECQRLSNKADADISLKPEIDSSLQAKHQEIDPCKYDEEDLDMEHLDLQQFTKRDAAEEEEEEGKEEGYSNNVKQILQVNLERLRKDNQLKQETIDNLRRDLESLTNSNENFVRKIEQQEQLAHNLVQSLKAAEDEREQVKNQLRFIYEENICLKCQKGPPPTRVVSAQTISTEKYYALKESEANVSSLMHKIQLLESQIHDVNTQKLVILNQHSLLQKQLEKLSRFLELLIEPKLSGDSFSTTKVFSEISSCLDGTIQLSRDLMHEISNLNRGDLTEFIDGSFASDSAFSMTSITDDQNVDGSTIEDVSEDQEAQPKTAELIEHQLNDYMKHLQIEREKVETLEAEKHQLNQQLSEAQEKNKKLNTDLERTVYEKSILEQENIRSKANSSTVESMCDDLRNELLLTKERLQNMYDRCSLYEKDITNLNERNKDLAETKQYLEYRISFQTCTFNDLNEKYLEIYDLLRQERLHHTKLMNENTSLMNTIQHLKERSDSTEKMLMSQLEDCKKHLQLEKEKVGTLQADKHLLNLQLTDAKEKNESFRKHLERQTYEMNISEEDKRGMSPSEEEDEEEEQSKTTVEDAESLCKDLRQQLSLTENKLQELYDKCTQYEKDINNSKDEKKDLIHEKLVLEEKLGTHLLEASRLNTKVHEIQSLLKEEQTKGEALQSKNLSLLNAVQQLEARNYDAENMLNQLEKRNKELQLELDQVKDLVIDRESTISCQEKQIQDVLHEKSVLEEKICEEKLSFDEEMSSFSVSYEVLRQELDSKKSEIEKLKKENDALCGQIEKLEEMVLEEKLISNNLENQIQMLTRESNAEDRNTLWKRVKVLHQISALQKNEQITTLEYEMVKMTLELMTCTTETSQLKEELKAKSEIIQQLKRELDRITVVEKTSELKPKESFEVYCKKCKSKIAETELIEANKMSRISHKPSLKEEPTDLSQDSSMQEERKKQIPRGYSHEEKLPCDLSRWDRLKEIPTETLKKKALGKSSYEEEPIDLSQEPTVQEERKDEISREYSDQKEQPRDLSGWDRLRKIPAETLKEEALRKPSYEEEPTDLSQEPGVQEERKEQILREYSDQEERPRDLSGWDRLRKLSAETLEKEAVPRPSYKEKEEEPTDLSQQKRKEKIPREYSAEEKLPFDLSRWDKLRKIPAETLKEEALRKPSYEEESTDLSQEEGKEQIPLEYSDHEKRPRDLSRWDRIKKAPLQSLNEQTYIPDEEKKPTASYQRSEGQLSAAVKKEEATTIDFLKNRLSELQRKYHRICWRKDILLVAKSVLVQRLTAEINEKNETLENLEAEIHDKKIGINSLEKQLETVEQQKALLEVEKQDIFSHISEAENETKSVQAMLLEMRKQMQATEFAHKCKIKEVEDLTKQLNGKDNEIHRLQKKCDEIDILKSKLQKYKEMLDEAVSEKKGGYLVSEEEEDSSISLYQKKFQDLHDENTQLSSQLSETKNILHEREEICRDFQDQINLLRAEIKRLKTTSVRPEASLFQEQSDEKAAFPSQESSKKEKLETGTKLQTEDASRMVTKSEEILEIPTERDSFITTQMGTKSESLQPPKDAKEYKFKETWRTAAEKTKTTEMDSSDITEMDTESNSFQPPTDAQDQELKTKDAWQTAAEKARLAEMGTESAYLLPPVHAKELKTKDAWKAAAEKSKLTEIDSSDVVQMDAASVSFQPPTDAKELKTKEAWKTAAEKARLVEMDTESASLQPPTDAKELKTKDAWKAAAEKAILAEMGSKPASLLPPVYAEELKTKGAWRTAAEKSRLAKMDTESASIEPPVDAKVLKTKDAWKAAAKKAILAEMDSSDIVRTDTASVSSQPPTYAKELKTKDAWKIAGEKARLGEMDIESASLQSPADSQELKTKDAWKAAARIAGLSEMDSSDVTEIDTTEEIKNKLAKADLSKSSTIDIESESLQPSRDTRKYEIADNWRMAFGKMKFMEKLPEKDSSNTNEIKKDPGRSQESWDILQASTDACLMMVREVEYVEKLNQIEELQEYIDHLKNKLQFLNAKSKNIKEEKINLKQLLEEQNFVIHSLSEKSNVTHEQMTKLRESLMLTSKKESEAQNKVTQLQKDLLEKDLIIKSLSRGKENLEVLVDQSNIHVLLEIKKKDALIEDMDIRMKGKEDLIRQLESKLEEKTRYIEQLSSNVKQDDIQVSQMEDKVRKSSNQIEKLSRNLRFKTRLIQKLTATSSLKEDAVESPSIDYENIAEMFKDELSDEQEELSPEEATELSDMLERQDDDRLSLKQVVKRLGNLQDQISQTQSKTAATQTFALLPPEDAEVTNVINCIIMKIKFEEEAKVLQNQVNLHLKKLQTSEKKNRNLKNRNAYLEQKLNENDLLVLRLLEGEEVAKMQLSEFEKKLETLKGNEIELKSQLAEMRRELSSKDSYISDLSQEKQTFQDTANQPKSSFQDMQQDSENVKRQLSVAHDKLEDNYLLIVELEQQLKEKSDLVGHLEFCNEESIKRIADLKGQLEVKEEFIKQQALKLEEKVNHIPQLGEELAQCWDLNQQLQKKQNSQEDIEELETDSISEKGQSHESDFLEEEELKAKFQYKVKGKSRSKLVLTLKRDVENGKETIRDLEEKLDEKLVIIQDLRHQVNKRNFDFEEIQQKFVAAENLIAQKDNTINELKEKITNLTSTFCSKLPRSNSFRGFDTESEMVNHKWSLQENILYLQLEIFKYTAVPSEQCLTLADRIDTLRSTIAPTTMNPNSSVDTATTSADVVSKVPKPQILHDLKADVEFLKNIRNFLKHCVLPLVKRTFAVDSASSDEIGELRESQPWDGSQDALRARKRSSPTLTDAVGSVGSLLHSGHDSTAPLERHSAQYALLESENSSSTHSSSSTNEIFQESATINTKLKELTGLQKQFKLILVESQAKSEAKQQKLAAKLLETTKRLREAETKLAERE